MKYFENKEELKERAKKHTFNVNVGYKEEIRECIQNSIIYGPEHTFSFQKTERDIPALFRGTSTEALFRWRKNYGDSKKICLLNFASYKNPGGLFFEGSNAQEESLCHDSFLYNVLFDIPGYYEWNNANLNRGLYMDRAVYSPDVVFFSGTRITLADVITCAAPNWNAGRYNKVSEKENLEVLKQRILFLKGILGEHMPDITILGAWGCGVFKQDAATVARIFLEDDYPMANDCVVYAIPDKENYDSFFDVFVKMAKLPF